MKRYITIIMIALILVGCSENMDSKKNKSIDVDYKEFITENKNFRVTTYINELEFKVNEEIKMYSTLEYIGE